MTKVIRRPPRSKVGLMSTILLVSAVCFLMGFYAARFLGGSGADAASTGGLGDSETRGPADPGTGGSGTGEPGEGTTDEAP